MQKLTQWSINKALPVLCLLIICLVFPGMIYFWKTHPQVEQQVSTTESNLITDSSGEQLQLPENSGPPPLPPGTKAVDFTSTTVDGKSYVFDSQSPNIKVVEFWATWCGPCHMSIPALERIYSDLKSQGVQVVGVSVDAPDTAGDVKPTVAALGMKYTVLVDPNSNIAAQQSYNAQALPSLYIIDGKGIVRWSFSGYWQGEEPYVRQIISNLQEGKPVGLS